MAGPLIIDAHMHVYPSKEEGLCAKKAYNGGWEFDDPRPGPAYSRYDGDLEDALEAIEEGGVSRAIMVNLFPYLKYRYQRIEELPPELGETERQRAIGEIEASTGEGLKSYNLWACQAVKDHPRLLPFVCIDPWVLEAEDAKAHLLDMAENHGARGLKLHSVNQRFHMGDGRMWPIYRTCVELGLPVVAHSGKTVGRDQLGDPRAFGEVLKSFPELKIVMAHMGNGAWRQCREIAATYPNALFDCSELMEWIGAPTAPTGQELAQLIVDIGPERVMMGTDFPWWAPDHCVARVMEFPLLSTDEKEAILGANAARLLGI